MGLGPRHRIVRMLFRVFGALLTSLLLCWGTYSLSPQPAGSITHPAWLPAARIGLWVAVALGIVAVHVLQRAFRGEAASVLRERGTEPDELLVSVAVMFGMCGVIGAFFLRLMGGSQADVYGTLLVAIGLTAFWCWRKRHVFYSQRAQL